MEAIYVFAPKYAVTVESRGHIQFTHFENSSCCKVSSSTSTASGKTLNVSNSPPSPLPPAATTCVTLSVFGIHRTRKIRWYCFVPTHSSLISLNGNLEFNSFNWMNTASKRNLTENRCAPNAILPEIEAFFRIWFYESHFAFAKLGRRTRTIIFNLISILWLLFHESRWGWRQRWWWWWW